QRTVFHSMRRSNRRTVQKDGPTSPRRPQTLGDGQWRQRLRRPACRRRIYPPDYREAARFTGTRSGEPGAGADGDLERQGLCKDFRRSARSLGKAGRYGARNLDQRAVAQSDLRFTERSQERAADRRVCGEGRRSHPRSGGVLVYRSQLQHTPYPGVPRRLAAYHLGSDSCRPGRGGRHLMNEEISADLLGVVCPAPVFNHKQIVLGHGSGGKLTSDLIQKVFLPAFDNDYLSCLDDQAVLQLNGSRVAFTTDAFVVTPIFFPGGDIGRLAINGTVNDLAMSGAKPLYIAAAFILEEGLATDELQRVVNSMSAAAREANVLLVTGDTKVVNRGKGDKLFITTTGLGL